MLDNLTNLLAVLIALSVASERLVDIIKNLSPWLSLPKADALAEGRRKAALQVLAVLAGIGTALLARSVLPTQLQGLWPLLGLGLLASGGAGFWTSVLGYVTSVKDIAKVKYDQQDLQTAAAAANLAGGSPVAASLRRTAGIVADEVDADSVPSPASPAVQQAAQANLARVIERISARNAPAHSAS